MAAGAHISRAEPPSVVVVMSPGRAGATPTVPPRCDEKSLTKKLSPPMDRRMPFMKPPRVDVVISTTPRVMAIAPASTRTEPPAGTAILANANEGPQLIATSMKPTLPPARLGQVCIDEPAGPPWRNSTVDQQGTDQGNAKYPTLNIMAGWSTPAPGW